MAALAGLSLLGIIISLVMLIISAIKKKGNVKKWGIGIAICFVLMIVGAVNSGSSNETMSPSDSTTAVSDADKAINVADDKAKTAAEKPAASQEPATTTASKDATVMEELRQIKELEGKNIKLVEVYNQVANLAVKNGWEADALTLKELNAADEVIKTFNAIITKPSSAHGADLGEMLSAADELITELDTNIRRKVSEPFVSKK